MQPSLNQNSSQESRKSTSEAVFELLSDFFFDKVTFLTGPGSTPSTATTLTTDFRTLLRVPDTSTGKYIKPNRKSRFRTLFYVTGGVEAADFYILSPAMYRSTTLASDVTNLNTFDSYVGIRSNAGVVSLESKSRGNTVSTPSKKVLVTETTYLLEILYNINYADIYIDNQLIGSVNCDLQEFLYNQITMYPFFGPIKSKAGGSVNLTFENYQFIQDK